MKSFGEFLRETEEAYLDEGQLGTTRWDAVKRAAEMHGRKQDVKIKALAGGSKSLYYGVHAGLPALAAHAGGIASGHPALGPIVTAAAVAPAVAVHGHQLWQEYKQVRARQKAKTD